MTRILLLLALLPVLACAETWQVSDIRVNGLQRVSPGIVFGALPAEAGDVLDEVSVQQLVRSLFRTGFFDDIRMARDGEVPGRKVGKEWRFHRTTLRRWIAGESETATLMEAIKQQGLKVTKKKR